MAKYTKTIFCLCLMGFSFNIAVSQGVEGTVGSLESQTDYRQYAATIVPPAPNAFSFSRYGSLPIGLNTGTMQFSLPIYTIQSGSLTHSVSLSYATNGVKVDEQSGWVGMNWNLLAGGVVTRTILDKQDELYPNNTAYSYAGSDVVDNSNSSFYNFVHQASNPTPPDFQPDEYSYNVGGYKGKFIKRTDGYFKQYNANGVKIEQNSSGFMLTAPTGVKYYFYQVQSTKPIIPPQAHWGLPYSEFSPTAWYLTKIKSPTNDSIVFTYSGPGIEKTYINGVSQQLSMYSRDYMARRGPTDGTPVWPNPQQELPFIETNVEKTKNYPFYINTITFKGGQVVFVMSDRDDQPAEKKADTIKIIRSGDNQLIKCFALNYTYSNFTFSTFDTYVDNSNFTDENLDLRKRLFLMSVDELSNDLASKQRHLFEYDDINNLPPRCSFSQDRLGYFNGKVNQYFFPGDTWFDWYIGNNYFGGNRNYSFTHAKKGTLKKITYPTGGYTSVEYEPNRQDGPHGWALRIDSSTYTLFDTSTASFNLVVSDTFHYNSQRRLHLRGWCEWATIPIPPTPPMTSYGGIGIQILDASNNSVVYSTSISPGESIENGLLGLYEFAFPYGVYKLKMTGTSHMRAKVKVEKHWKEYDSASLAIAGVRVKSIADYANPNEETNRREFYYGLSNESEWSEFSGLGLGLNVYQQYNEVSLSRMLAIGYGNLPESNQVYCGYNTIQSSSLQVAYKCDAGTVTYPKVIEILYASNNRNNGGTEYEFYYEDKEFPKAMTFSWGQYVWNPTPALVAGGAPMNNDFTTGLTKRVRAFTFNEKFGARTFLNETKNYYSVDTTSMVTDSFYIVKEALKRTGTTNPSWRYFFDYDINKYYKYYGFLKLDSSISMVYNSGNQLKNKVAYTYTSANYKVSSETHYLSNGEDKDVFYRYPPNITSSETDYSDYQGMSLANMIDMPVDQSVVKNSTTQSQKTYFDSYTIDGKTFYGPSHVQSKLNSNAAETEISFEQYDSQGNILQFIGKDGIKISIIWGYDHTYPVAKIVGADYDTAIALVNTSVIDNPSSDAELRSELNNLRTGLTGKVLVTTTTYAPLIGMTSQTDVNGNTVYYEYDSFNRLKLIRDKDSNVLKKYQYKYVSQ